MIEYVALGRLQAGDPPRERLPAKRCVQSAVALDKSVTTRNAAKDRRSNGPKRRSSVREDDNRWDWFSITAPCPRNSCNGRVVGGSVEKLNFMKFRLPHGATCSTLVSVYSILRLWLGYGRTLPDVKLLRRCWLDAAGACAIMARAMVCRRRRRSRKDRKACTRGCWRRPSTLRATMAI